MQVRTAADTESDRIQEGWGSLRLLADKDTLNSDKLTLARVIIERGHSNPRHSHPDCYELLHLLRGRLEYVIAEDHVILEPGDTIAIPAGVPHYGIALGDEDAEMIVAYSAGERSFQPEPPAD